MLVVLLSYTLYWSVTNRSEQCTSFSTNIMFLSRNTWHNNKESLLERYYFLITILYKLWACFASTPQINIFVKCRTTLYFTPNHWSFGHKIAKGSFTNSNWNSINFFKKILLGNLCPYMKLLKNLLQLWKKIVVFMDDCCFFLEFQL